MLSRRNFLTGSALLISAAAVSGRAAAAVPEAHSYASPAMQPPLPPPAGQSYQPVVTLNGWSLPWRMNGEWKEFHLVAEVVTREIDGEIHEPVEGRPQDLVGPHALARTVVRGSELLVPELVLAEVVQPREVEGHGESMSMRVVLRQPTSRRRGGIW